MAQIIPFPIAREWTLEEHDALTLLAARLHAEVEFHQSEEGDPEACFTLPHGYFSVVRERGRVAVLDEEGNRLAEAGTVGQVVQHLRGEVR